MKNSELMRGKQMVSIQFDKNKWIIGEKAFKVIMSITSIVFIISLSFGLQGCDYHHADNSSSYSSNEIRYGVFLDSPVQGLHYKTETQSGTTDVDGSFQYMDGEMIMFSMGGIVLGGTMADAVMTPISMVPAATDETHPMVTNMLRFIQTLDLDNNPENGITLPPNILDELEGRPIYFDMDPDEFEHNVDIQMFMDTIHELDENYAGRMMISIGDAQNHMSNTMMDMMNGGIPNEGEVGDGSVPGEGEAGNGGMMPGGGGGMM